jgi:hypothetical protein
MKERVAALETLVTSGNVVSTAARLSALDARMTANEKANDRAILAAENTQKRADEVLTKRFDASNEVRGAMKDASSEFVKRGEFYWAMGAVILFLAGAIIGLLVELAKVSH